MDESVIVGISDLKAVRRPGRLITYALGSCVGVVLLDSGTGVGGLAHVMLPDSNLIRSDKKQEKFADTAVPLLVRTMERMGARRGALCAKIAGGAMLFGTTDTMRIGQRNVAAVKQQLAHLGIRLTAEDTGLNYGRTMELDTASGRVTIKTALHGIQEL